MAYTSEYPIFSVTVDVVCLAVHDDEVEVLMVERGQDPFAGRLALPGGFVDIGEDLEAAARRELEEETSVQVPEMLEQLGAYGRPDRDPRGRTVSIAYLAVAAERAEATGGSDAAAAGWHSVRSLLADPGSLAFDHDVILHDAVERAASRMRSASSVAEVADAGGPDSRFALAEPGKGPR